MNIKKLLYSIIFPHIAIMIVLLPFATVFLVYSMIFLGTESVVSIISYVVAAYTLTVWCFKIPMLIRKAKAFKKQNKYINIWQSDTRLRVNISLYGTLIFNTAYAVLQLGLGFWHGSYWYYSLAAYYILLAVMRFFLLLHTRKHTAGENMIKELKKYRSCGIIFLIMNLAIAVIITFMTAGNKTFIHHEITTITMAAYTFCTLTMAIINTARYKKYNSPVYSAAKAISLASALVSMLTLESTMLTTFGNETMSISERKIMLASSGGVISVFIVGMAIYMIVNGTRKIKNHK